MPQHAVSSGCRCVKVELGSNAWSEEPPTCTSLTRLLPNKDHRPGGWPRALRLADRGDARSISAAYLRAGVDHFTLSFPFDLSSTVIRECWPTTRTLTMSSGCPHSL